MPACANSHSYCTKPAGRGYLEYLMRLRPRHKITAALSLALAFLLAPLPSTSADEATPDVVSFEAFPGRWVGEGRLAFRDGKVEKVKCRVTYFVADDRASMRQNVRCASAAGRIELKSEIHRSGGKLTGTWNETVYEMRGELTGRAIKNGLIVHVEGEAGLTANMQLLVKDVRQIIEVQFERNSLIGLTLLLRRG